MKINDKIRDQKVHYNINREAAKSSALSSDKTDKYKFLTGEGVLASDQRRVIEQAKYTYSPLRKALEKQKKGMKDQGEKQIKTIEDHGEQQTKALGNGVKKNFRYTSKVNRFFLCYQKIF